jgi:hypothetical protein
MLTLKKTYRTEYTGENIVVERHHTGGVWHDQFEFVPNAVFNNQISNKACVIGNGPSRATFNLELLDHPMGILGADSLQTYGCNAVYRDYTPDFLICSGSADIVKELAEGNYIKDNVVYTNAHNLLAYPNKFYLLPNDPYTDAGTAALSIAAFDGHKKIYMLGFDGQDSPGYNYNIYAGTNGYEPLIGSKVLDYKWIEDHKKVFDVYTDVKFIRVTPKGREPIPESWKYCTNFSQIDFRTFVLECGI